MSWSQFLEFLSQPNGITAAVGVLLSFAVEYIPKYDGLAPKWKRLIFLGACLLVPLVAATLGVLTAEWPLAWEPTYWQAVLAGGIAFGGGTVAHTRKL